MTQYDHRRPVEDKAVQGRPVECLDFQGKDIVAQDRTRQQAMGESGQRDKEQHAVAEAVA